MRVAVSGDTGTAALRRRAAIELSVAMALTALYLGLLPRRPVGLDAAMGLVGLGLVAVLARDTRRRFWGVPAKPARDRLRRSVVTVGLVTLAALLALALYGAWDAFSMRGEWLDVAARLHRPAFFAALLLYVPWAWLQQALFQFHLLARWRALWPSARPAFLAAVNGLSFGLVHWPEWDLVALATAGGMVWSSTYLRDRCLWPIALSHALAGTALFYWVEDTDLVAAVLG